MLNSILKILPSTSNVNIILKVGSDLKQNTTLSVSVSVSRRLLTFFVKTFQCRIIHVTDCHKDLSSHFA